MTNASDTTAITALELSPRVREALHAAQVYTVGELAEHLVLGKLKHTRGIGTSALAEIRRALQRYRKMPSTRGWRITAMLAPLGAFAVALIAICVRFLLADACFTYPGEFDAVLYSVAASPGLTTIVLAVMGWKSLSTEIEPCRARTSAVVLVAWSVTFATITIVLLWQDYGISVAGETVFQPNATLQSYLQTLCTISTPLLVLGIAIGVLPTRLFD